MRPTQSLILNFESLLNLSKLLRLDQWVIDTYAAIVDELRLSQRENRAMTGPLPACASLTNPPPFRPASFDNEPLTAPDGQILAYDKPIIFLVDEFSVSFGDIFPAMMQDNGRGPIVGMRTGGWGGSVSSWPVGFYSEASASNTNSMVVRRGNIISPDLPATPFLENIGVIPDVELDFMTRENLLTRGAPFVAGFTKVIDEEIAKAKAP